MCAPAAACASGTSSRSSRNSTVPAGYGRSSWRVLDAEHPRAARDEVDPPVGQPLEHLGDLARAADRPQPVVGQPHDPELRLLLEAAPDHRLVALLEDVQRDQLARQRDEAQREQREVLDQLARSIQDTARTRTFGRCLRPPSSGSGATCASTTTRRCGRRSTPSSAWCRCSCSTTALLDGRHASGSRTRFMLECLDDLREALQQRGGNLVIARGTPERELPKLAARARRDRGLLRLRRVARSRWRRDQRVEAALAEHGVEPRRTPGNFVADIGKPKPYAVFTPFWRAWKELPRREIHGAPRNVPVPGDLDGRRDPEARRSSDHVPDPMPGGETHARKRMHAWLRDGIDTYAEHHDRVSGGTSMLSPVPALRLRLGPRARGEGRPPRRLHAPARVARLLRPRAAAQPRQRHARLPQASSTRSTGTAATSTSTPGARAAPAIRSSTPACASSAATGWMHNRARLITACFLVKDLHIDWRRGERHFMRSCSTATRPTTTATGSGSPRSASTPRRSPPPLQPGAPAAAPRSQGRVRPPLGARSSRDVPLDKLATPWEAGHDDPIVDHAVERRRTLEAYAAARA